MEWRKGHIGNSNNFPVTIFDYLVFFVCWLWSDSERYGDLIWPKTKKYSFQYTHTCKTYLRQKVIVLFFRIVSTIIFSPFCACHFHRKSEVFWLALNFSVVYFCNKSSDILYNINVYYQHSIVERLLWNRWLPSDFSRFCYSLSHSYTAFVMNLCTQQIVQHLHPCNV